MNKLFFAGHETFSCKQFWLKKGCDYIANGFLFNEPIAIIELGVGKNMVNSIQFWLKAFGLLADDNKTLTAIAHKLLANEPDGSDPYIEDLGTVWLLHYLLIKTEKASIYHLIFNYFGQQRFEFNKDILLKFLMRKNTEQQINTSIKTLENDISVFLRTYIKPEKNEGRIEDVFSAVLLELNLVECYEKTSIDGHSTEWYKIPNKNRSNLPFHIVLYSILELMEVAENKSSITFAELERNINSPVRIFALSLDSLQAKIDEIVDYGEGNIVYTEAAGLRVLQFKASFNKSKIDILNDYYKK